MGKKLKVAIIIGSRNDLAQCLDGLKYLKGDPNLKVVGVYIRSQHRNTLETQALLKKLVEMKVDIIITAAGWANHLTGCVDAFLRYTLKDKRIVVLGVAIEDLNSKRHTEAAVLSITEVPGTQVVFREGDSKLTGQNAIFIGRQGFLRACMLAAEGDFKKIELPEAKPPMDLTLDAAIKMAE
ncbi:MAG: AIR carboxylase family protein [Patescibacteria group bacterium]